MVGSVYGVCVKCFVRKLSSIVMCVVCSMLGGVMRFMLMFVIF